MHLQLRSYGHRGHTRTESVGPFHVNDDDDDDHDDINCKQDKL